MMSKRGREWAANKERASTKLKCNKKRTLADGCCASSLLPKSSGGNKWRSLNAMFK